jgi:hypothetical protein
MDITTNAILDAVKCMGGDQGIIYVTVPITTGLREFNLMNDLKCDRSTLRIQHQERWLNEVKRPNEADAEAFALMVQLQYQDRLVLNPAALQVEGWSQDQYTSMWNQVLAEFCDTLVVTPDWAFSNGARLEVQQMFVLGREVVDVFGKRLSVEAVKNANELAFQKLNEMNWTKERIDEMLIPMKIPRVSGMSYRRFAHTDWNAAIKWILEERKWQRRIEDFRDDQRTTNDGPRGRSGEWYQLMNKYYSRAQELGIHTELGGMNLMIYVTLAVAYLESVIHVFGEMPEPGMGSGAPLRMSRVNVPSMEPNQRLALAVAWLRREYFYTSEKYPSDIDDENTEFGITTGTWWDRQLKIYWDRAFEKGLDDPAGRQALGKFVSTAMNLATSRFRIYGKPQFPKRRTAEEILPLS